jgi:mono/diheme cytochrome c family protein
MRTTILRSRRLVGWPGLLTTCAILLLTSLPIALADDSKPISPEASAFFETRVRPVLAEHCLQCHGAKKQSGGLRLDSRAAILKGGDGGPAIVEGDPDKSLIVQAIRHQGELKMPEKGKLPDPAIEAVAHWVKIGAPWPSTSVPSEASKAEIAKKHWSLQPVVDPALPKVEHSDRIFSPVDAFILAKLEAKKLEPSGLADKRTLIRRVTYDLTGLPPTSAESEAFLADDSPQAYSKVIDRLLASPRYGERWGRHWLDVARYADTKGYVFTEERRYPYSYTYRDYVIRSFNEDKPYDRFIVEQIAADKLELNGDPRPLAGLGFLTVGRRFLNDQNEIIDDRIDVVTRGLMGLSVTCARCHDHKFDPIPTEDYYSLHGVFASSIEPETLPLLPDPVPEADKAAYDREHQIRVNQVEEEKLKNQHKIEVELRNNLGAFIAASCELKFEPQNPKLDEIARKHRVSPERLKFIARRLAKVLEKSDKPDPILTPWRIYSALPEAEFASRSMIETSKFLNPTDPAVTLDPVVQKAFEGDPPRSLEDVARRYGSLFERAEKDCDINPDPTLQPLKDRLHVDANGLLDLDARALRRILNRAEREHLEATEKKIRELDVTHPGSPAHAMVMNDSPNPTNPHVYIRGNPGRPGKQVPRRFLRALSVGDEAKPFTIGSGRLELARAIASPDNPLTARVLVNRIWHHHFGVGLVATPSDFGVRGDLPSHPELLDFLARRFIESGWSVKAMHRLILLSSTYQQKSDKRDDAFESDPRNQLLWKQNRQRLDYEALRDGILAASGKLDLRIGGRPVELFETRTFSTRRTVYGFVDRYDLDGTFRTFDFPSPDISNPMRSITTVPQQALFLMNSPFLLEQAKALAHRPDLPPVDDPVARINRLYLDLFGRLAEPNEIEAARKFLESQAKPEGDKGPTPWEEYAQVLLMTNEFIFID